MEFSAILNIATEERGTMKKILIIGATGYAGSAIVDEAVARGYKVTALSRSAPTQKNDKVTYVEGSVLDATLRQTLVADADVIVGTLAPRGDMAGKVAGIYKELAVEAQAHHARFFVVGGFGSLRPLGGVPRFVDGDDFEEAYKPEALELASVLDFLKTDAPEGLDWLYISPAATFGAFNPGAKTGNYTIAGEVAVFDKNGESNLSSQDLALAIVDEIVTPKHQAEHISVVTLG